MKILPTVLVRNEAYYIADVLRPLAAIFSHVLLGDTGSTDDTPERAAGIAGVEIVPFGLVDAHQFTQA